MVELKFFKVAHENEKDTSMRQAILVGENNIGVMFTQICF